VASQAVENSVGESGFTLEGVSEALETVARDFEQWAPPFVKAPLPRDDETIEELVLQLQRYCRGTPERLALAKRIHHKRRALRRRTAKREEAERAMREPRDDKRMGTTQFEYLEEKVGGEWLKITNPEDWEGVVRRFYANLFDGPCREALEFQAAQLRKKGLARRLAGQPEAEVTTLMLFGIQQELKRDKAGHPEEALVPNIIAELPIDVIERLAQLFTYRLKGLQREPARWKKIWIHCIGKIARPKRVSEWRPLSLLCALEKLFDRAVAELLREAFPPVCSRSIGFQRGRQAQEVVQILVELTSKAAEWDMALVVARGDIHKAFDSMPRAGMAEMFAYHDIEPNLAATTLENLVADLDVHLGPVRAQDIPFLRGGKQGGSSTPELWKQFLHYVIGRELCALEAQGFGFEIEDEHGKPYFMNHIIYADDVWVLARSESEARNILTKVTEQLLAYELQWKRDEKMTISSNAHVADYTSEDIEIVVHGALPFTFKRTSIVECVGGALDINGDPSCLVEKRIEAMKAHFWNRAKQLKNRRVPLVNRLTRLAKTVRRSGLYLTGSMIWTQKLAHKFMTAEAELVRRAWGPRRRADEDWLQWQIRTHRGARALMARIGQQTILQDGLKANFRWAGHIARMDPKEDVRRVVLWKGTAWWHERQRTMAKRDPLNKTHWRHPRPGQVPRWDKGVVEQVGEDWMNIAADRERWKKMEGIYVTQRHGSLLPPKTGRALGDAEFIPYRHDYTFSAPAWSDW